jgi:hypothetical protein
MKIARVFPRKTVASPTDELAFFTEPPRIGLPEITEVHVSVAFSWDMPRAEWLEHQWKAVGVPVKFGGPVFNRQDVADDRPFVPGMYLKNGYVITSRGCPKHCWFCKVGDLRELEIKDGWNVLDDNLLACSESHIREVFEMLSRQKERPAFTGGLEPSFLKPWHCELLAKAKPSRMYFAYDTPDDLAPLTSAGQMLHDAGFKTSNHQMCCYVLIGYSGDTFDKAEQRLTETIEAGFMPYAMLYRDEKGLVNCEWKKFQREWLRPKIVATKMSMRGE